MNKFFKTISYLWKRFSIVELAVALFVIGIGFHLLYAVAMAWLFHNLVYLVIFVCVIALVSVPLYRMYRLVKKLEELNDKAN